MVVSRKLGELRAGRHDDDDDESGDADGGVMHAGACQLSQPTCCSRHPKSPIKHVSHDTHAAFSFVTLFDMTITLTFT